MSPGYVASLGLVPREVCLDPGDSGQLVPLCENALPQVSVLETGDMSPLEGACKGVRDVPTVCQYMNSGLSALDDVEDGKDFPSLSGLMWSLHRSAGAFSVEGGEAPSCSWSARRIATASVRGDDVDGLR